MKAPKLEQPEVEPPPDVPVDEGEGNISAVELLVAKAIGITKGAEDMGGGSVVGHMVVRSLGTVDCVGRAMSAASAGCVVRRCSWLITHWKGLTGGSGLGGLGSMAPRGFGEVQGVRLAL